MAVNEVNLASAALAIAIVALVIALGQLLQQLFGSADGYRKCQDSVIGDWSKLVKLRFRWSSLRLEVRVTTPHLLIRKSGLYGANDGIIVKLDGSEHTRGLTFTRADSRDDDDENEDMVSWTSLLKELHNCQQLQLLDTVQATQYLGGGGLSSNGEDIFRHFGDATVHASRKTRSWDLMPPDVVRPLASSILGTLVAIAHRLGMVWVDFVPGEGRIRAEGLGQSISATLMRGMGIVVEFSVESGSRPARPELYRSFYVPTLSADKMAFGIIPGNGRRSTWDLKLRSREHDPDTKLIILALVEILQQRGSVMGSKYGMTAAEAIRESVSHKDGIQYWPGFVDILGLWSDWVPIPSSPINTVISPIGHWVHTLGTSYEARVVWKWILGERERQGRISPVQQSILCFYNLWADRYPSAFNRRYRLQPNNPRAMEERKFYQDMYDATSIFFDQEVEKSNSWWYYVTLVGSHVAVNAHSLKEADENMAAGKERPIGDDLSNQTFRERAFLYVDNIPTVVEDMTTRYRRVETLDAAEVEDAWWMLMVRMQSWEMGINRVVQKTCVPSSYYGSPTRVYIM